MLNADGTRSFLTKNAEGAKVSGFESELAAQVTLDDRLQLTMAFTKTKLGKLLGLSNGYALPTCTADPSFGGCLDVTGHKLAHAPTFAAQVLYEHTMHLAGGALLRPRVSVHYETASWLSIFNLGDADKQKAYTRTDIGMRYMSGKSWYFDAYARNLEDKNIKTRRSRWRQRYFCRAIYAAAHLWHQRRVQLLGAGATCCFVHRTKQHVASLHHCIIRSPVSPRGNRCVMYGNADSLIITMNRHFQVR